jgi:hypothetical protein
MSIAQSVGREQKGISFIGKIFMKFKERWEIGIEKLSPAVPFT